VVRVAVRNLKLLGGMLRLKSMGQGQQSGSRFFSPILLLLLVQQDTLNTLLTKDRQIELPLRYLRKLPWEGWLKAEQTAWTTPSGPTALPKRQTTSTKA